MSGTVKDQTANSPPSLDAVATALTAGQRVGSEAPSSAPDFRLLFESLPGLVLVLLPDAPRFTLIAVSDAYLAATMTQRMILGQGLFQVFPDNPNDPAADGVRNLHASLDRVIASQRADTMALQKYDVERPDGSGFEEKWWSPVNTPLLLAGGIRYIVHQVLDVTEEMLLKRESVRQASALAESEARYKALADNSPAMIIRCLNAPGWPMLYVSKAAEEITGYPAEDFTERGLLYGSLVLEQDQDALAASIEKQLAKGRDVRVQYRIRHKDGSLRWIEGFARLTTLPDGREGFEGTNTDVSASKEAELLLAERADALERARIATTAARVAPYTWYIEQDRLEIDTLGETLHGLLPGTCTGKLQSLLAEVHPEDQQPLAKAFADAAALIGAEFQAEYRTVTAQGRVRWLRSIGSVSNEDGALRLVGAVMDVTLEVEVQRALEDRTREMERANAELDEFTYIASHDLKEPLRGIHNYARFIAEDYADKLDAGGQHMLKAVSEQAERMQRLIEDLLEIARLGREPMQRKQTNLDVVVDEVLASLSFSLAEKKVAVRKEPLGSIICDPVRVAEVFRNLITNALKYNDKQTPVIEIGARESATGEREFYVQDNGIGIKADFHARVFAPFKRLHAKDAYGGGSGVGLAIVKRIVEAHGGVIGVSSQPGNGANFAFTLSGEHLT
ncbi:MAG: PAS domain-containing protein [Pseudomonadota bacterium]